MKTIIVIMLMLAAVSSNASTFTCIVDTELGRGEHVFEVEGTTITKQTTKQDIVSEVTVSEGKMYITDGQGVFSHKIFGGAMKCQEGESGRTYLYEG